MSDFGAVSPKPETGVVPSSRSVVAERSSNGRWRPRVQDFEAIPHIPEADSFQFQATLDMIKQALFSHYWLVAVTTALTMALVGAYIWIWPPTFQATVMLMADSDKDIQRTSFYQGWNVFRREGLTDESTLMVSTPTLKEVVRRLDLKYDDVYHPFFNYVIHLWGDL